MTESDFAFGVDRGVVPEIEDNRDMIMVRQNTWGVTRADRPWTILKTHDVLFCVAITLFDPKNYVAGLLHLDGSNYQYFKNERHTADRDIGKLIKVMEHNGADKNSLEAHTTWNIMFIHKLAWLTRESLIHLGINNISTILENDIAIDSKSGRVSRLINYEQNDTYDNESKWVLSRRTSLLPAFKTSDKRSLG